MSRQDRSIEHTTASPANTPESWESPAEPRNRLVAVVTGATLMIGFVARLVWRAYGPPFGARSSRGPAPAGLGDAFAAPSQR